MYENCKVLSDQVELQRQVIQQLIQGLEIMTVNARVLARMTEPKDTKEVA